VSLYVDASALLKRYLDEPDSDDAEEYLSADSVWITACHTAVEVRRNLARRVSGSSLAVAKDNFALDWGRIQVVELDAAICESAADIAEITGVRSLDALHLAVARRVGGTALTFLTFDLRQAQAARTLGLTVIGA